MELQSKDSVNNKISVLLVIPRSDRLYDYYIDGHSDKRTMLQRKMLEFCIELLPDHAAEIRRCIFEVTPFALFINQNEFKELKENEPPKINRRDLVFPMNKLVQADRIDHRTEKEDNIKKWSKNYSIWEQYQIHIDTRKRKAGIFT